MAFISEIHFRSADVGVLGNEFVEVTLGPNDDPADFVLSFYDANGNLDTLISALGVLNGEVTLSDLTGVPHPANPDFTVFTITSEAGSGLLINGGTGNNTVEANSIALTGYREWRGRGSVDQCQSQPDTQWRRCRWCRYHIDQWCRVAA